MFNSPISDLDLRFGIFLKLQIEVQIGAQMEEAFHSPFETHFEHLKIEKIDIQTEMK